MQTAERNAPVIAKPHSIELIAIATPDQPAPEGGGRRKPPDSVTPPVWRRTEEYHLHTHFLTITLEGWYGTV